MIAQAITNDALKPGDLCVPIHICLPHWHLSFAVVMGLHRKRGSRTPIGLWRGPGILIGHCTMTALQHGWDYSQRQQDPWAVPTPTSSLSPYCSFESDRSSVSTSSLVLLQPSRFGATGICIVADAARSPEAT